VLQLRQIQPEGLNLNAIICWENLSRSAEDGKISDFGEKKWNHVIEIFRINYSVEGSTMIFDFI
jgi:hypothetical protein